MILVKLGSFMFYRDAVMELIRFAEKNFWNVDYDETSARILEKYDKLGLSMIYTFTFIVYAATFNYIFAPFFGIILVLPHAFALANAIISRTPAQSDVAQHQRKFFFIFSK